MNSKRTLLALTALSISSMIGCISSPTLEGSWYVSSKGAVAPQSLTIVGREYTIDSDGDGTPDLSGSYSTDSDTVTFLGETEQGTVAGKYQFDIREDRLRFRVMKDESEVRKKNLGRIWIKRR